VQHLPSRRWTRRRSAFHRLHGRNIGTTANPQLITGKGGPDERGHVENRNGASFVDSRPWSFAQPTFCGRRTVATRRRLAVVFRNFPLILGDAERAISSVFPPFAIGTDDGAARLSLHRVATKVAAMSSREVRCFSLYQELHEMAIKTKRTVLLQWSHARKKVACLGTVSKRLARQKLSGRYDLFDS
jgi:hypothetical protein